MKNFFNYFLSFFAFAGLLFFASCGEDVELPDLGDPTISINPSDSVAVAPGDTVVIEVTFSGVEEGAEAQVVSDAAGGTFLPDNMVASGETVQFVVPQDAEAGGTYTLTFTVQGQNAQASEQLLVNVVVSIAEYEAVLLQAPIGQQPGERTSETFFSTGNGAVYSVEDVVAGTAVTSADIDFGYYYGKTNEASLASPFEYPEPIYDLGPNGANWGTLNQTLFRTTTLTSADFDAITVAQGDRLGQEFEVGANETQEITGLAAGQIYAFQTADGRYGLLRIDDINPGIESDRYITITVKVTDQ